MASVGISGAITAAITAAAVATSTALSVKAQKEAAAYRARVAENNARLAEYQRAGAIQRGAFEASRKVRQGRRIQARAKSIIGISGIEPTDGTAESPLFQTALAASADAQTIKANAARAAWGFDVQQTDLLAQAQQSRRAGFLGALGTGISGAARVAGTGVSAFGGR
jgi:hypothetical protein